MQVSYYKNAEDNTGGLVDFAKVLRNIKKGLWKDQVEALRAMSKEDYSENKRHLPCVTFSGTFLPTRHDAHVQQYNQILCLDIDHVTAEVLADLQDALTLDRHVLAMFVSPSGEGLKVLVRVDSETKDHYSAFECCRLYYKENYQVDLDVSGKNLARLCFISFDPDLFYNSEAIPFHVEINESNRQRIYGDRSVYSKEYKSTGDELTVYQVCEKWAEFHKPYVDGQRNTHIFILACSLNRCGLSQEQALLSIVRHKLDLPVLEIQTVVKNVYKNKFVEHKTITVFDFEKQQDASRGAMEMQSLGDVIDDLSMAPSQQLIKSGFEKRDKAFGGGKERGCAYAYVGREKTYKSVDAIKEACHLAMVENLPVLYLNGEMSKRQFMQIIAQQCLGIPRTRISEHFAEIKEFVSTKLTKLKVVTGKDFKFDSIVKTAEAFRVAVGEDIAEIFIDGIGHMEGGIDTPHLISNSKAVKEVAKACNEGRGAAVSVLIHTDANCNYWSRKPQTFIRGKVMVLSNFDGTVGFSRFLVPGSQNEDWSDFELRKDIYNIRAEDYRTVGGEVNVVMRLNENCAPSETEDEANLYEFTQETKKKY